MGRCPKPRDLTLSSQNAFWGRWTAPPFRRPSRRSGSVPGLPYPPLGFKQNTDIPLGHLLCGNIRHWGNTNEKILDPDQPLTNVRKAMHKATASHRSICDHVFESRECLKRLSRCSMTKAAGYDLSVHCRESVLLPRCVRSLEDSILMRRAQAASAATGSSAGTIFPRQRDVLWKGPFPSIATMPSAITKWTGTAAHITDAFGGTVPMEEVFGQPYFWPGTIPKMFLRLSVTPAQWWVLSLGHRHEHVRFEPAHRDNDGISTVTGQFRR